MDQQVLSMAWTAGSPSFERAQPKPLVRCWVMKMREESRISKVLDFLRGLTMCCCGGSWVFLLPHWVWVLLKSRYVLFLLVDESKRETMTWWGCVLYVLVSLVDRGTDRILLIGRPEWCLPVQFYWNLLTSVHLFTINSYGSTVKRTYWHS